MSVSIVGGKTLCFNEDPIGLDTIVTYTDQNRNECRIDMEKFYNLAKKSKDKYFKSGWLGWLKNKELTIGAFIITGLDKLDREFPTEVGECIMQEKKLK